jgi:methionine-gamma-lyase
MPKADKAYRKRSIGDRALHPESLMMSYGFDPFLSEGSIKPPIFATSTFAFRSAAEGEALFRKLAGRQQPDEPDVDALIYARFNNPNMEVLEDRLTLFDGGEEALAFSSGMSAITTALMACVPPGGVVLHSSPVYGASEVFIRTLMPDMFGVTSVEFDAWAGEDTIRAAADAARAHGEIAVIYTESPANPTNALVDLAAVSRVADWLEAETGKRPVIMCDNTMMGPVGHRPIAHGADLVLYSLTKYIGGHSDLIAGAVIGRSDLIASIRKLRNFFGGTLDAHTCWLLTRSLETVSLRMEKAFRNAATVAAFLAEHPKVSDVMYLGFLADSDPQKAVYERQCEAAGSTFSFDVAGGKDSAFRLLDNLKLIKLAVSLGGTESLACHPGSTTHSGVPEEIRARIGFTDGLIRLSIGIENADDLVADLQQALDAV